MENDERAASDLGEVVVREYVDADAPGVARMFNEASRLWPGGFLTTAEDIRDGRRTVSNLAVYLAVAGERVVGFCGLTADFGGDSRAAYVALLGAHPAALGRGVGRRLLRRSLDRTIELGYSRLDLHTWPGNTRAVPLYKKMGFCWVPETSVYMQNYLPLLLRHPLLRELLGEADWYAHYRRELQQAEDKHLLDGRPVFPYDFEREGRRLRLVVDRACQGVVAVAADDLEAGWELPEQLVAGESHAARLVLANRRSEPRPFRLFARGEAGLSAQRQAAGELALRSVLEVDARAGEAAEKGAAPKLVADLALGELALCLEAGATVVPPLEVQPEPGGLALLAGVPGELRLTVVSHLAEPARVMVGLVGSPGLRLATERVELELPAAGRASVRVGATAEPGWHSLTVALAAGERPVRPTALPVPAPRPGQVVAGMSPDGEPALESDRLRLVAQRRGGGVAIAERSTGRPIVTLGYALGPPYAPRHLTLRDREAQATVADGLGRLSLRADGARSALTCEASLTLSAAGLLTWRLQVGNPGTEPAAVRCQFSCGGLWPGDGESRSVLPLHDGVVASHLSGFPGWPPTALPASAYAEGWVAYESGERVVGLCWREIAALGFRRGGSPSVELDLGTLAPGEVRESPPLYVYVGPGDWREVRRRWRELLAPAASPAAPPLRPAVDVRLSRVGQVETTAPATLELRSALWRPLQGEVAVEPPPGWEVEPGRVAVEGLSLREPQATPVVLRHLGEPPAAAVARLRFDADMAEASYPLPLIRLGRRGEPVAVRPALADEQEVVEVENGWWSFAVAPGFAGSVFRLRRGATEHLASAFPTARPRFYLCPWRGGVAPSLAPDPAGARHGLGPEEASPAFAERPAWQPVAGVERLGAEWAGVQLAGPAPAAWPGLRVEVSYLTTGGSNLLLTLVRLTNGSASGHRVLCGLSAYLAVGGSDADAELHYLAGGPRLARRDPERAGWLRSGAWAAVRSPATGEVVCLVSGSPESTVYGLDWAAAGAHLASLAVVEVPPGGEWTQVSYLALAPDLASARVYRALAYPGGDR